MTITKAYSEKYKKGYGTMYPEGHVIRFYEKFLKFEMGIDGSKGQKIFDFGCGNGTHSEYFLSKGFKVYGVDIIKDAIESAKHRMPPSYIDNFMCIEKGQSIDNLFDTRFDIVFANQSLYYLSNSELENTLSQIDRILNPNGIVYFTMMGTESYYYNLSEEREDLDGLRTVTLKGRLNETTDIRFIHSREDLLQTFQLFKPDFVGHYDCSMREGSGFQYQFIGLKQ